MRVWKGICFFGGVSLCVTFLSFARGVLGVFPECDWVVFGSVSACVRCAVCSATMDAARPLASLFSATIDAARPLATFSTLQIHRSHLN